MSKVPSITWTEAALVQPGQKQMSSNPERSEIAYVVDADKAAVVVVYTDGSSRTYSRWEDLPILNED